MPMPRRQQRAVWARARARMTMDLSVLYGDANDRAAARDDLRSCQIPVGNAPSFDAFLRTEQMFAEEFDIDASDERGWDDSRDFAMSLDDIAARMPRGRSQYGPSTY